MCWLPCVGSYSWKSHVDAVDVVDDFSFLYVRCQGGASRSLVWFTPILVVCVLAKIKDCDHPFQNAHPSMTVSCAGHLHLPTGLTASVAHSLSKTSSTIIIIFRMKVSTYYQAFFLTFSRKLKLIKLQIFPKLKELFPQSSRYRRILLKNSNKAQGT